MILRSSACLLTGALCTLLLPASAPAAQVFVANHDFEADAQVDGDTDTGAPTGWTSTGDAFTRNPSADDYSNSNITDSSSPTGGTIGTMDGPNVALALRNSTISQILSEDVVVGTDYLLTVAVGDRNVPGRNNTFNAAFNLELWDGDSQLATTGDINPGGSGD